MSDLLAEYERIKGYRERGYSLSVTDQDRLTETVGLLSERIATLTDAIRRLTEVSPYPDFEDADGTCYWCGQKQGHHERCDYAVALALI